MNGNLPTFNHTIVAARDRQVSAEFLTELFGLPAPREVGRFLAVTLNHGVNLDYAQAGEDDDITPQHYAFLVSEDEFDAIYTKIRDRGMPHWADPRGQRVGEINHNDGGRGVYFRDPSGHAMEILTVPYGG